jgi:DNA repair protein RadC
VPLPELFGVAEETTMYRASPALVAAKALYAQALEQVMRRATTALNHPDAVRDYLRVRIGALPHEEFWVIYLDAQNRLLEAESLFRGTLTQTSVHPREVVKRALHFNAAAIIMAHNHPSGMPDPSAADTRLTQSLRDALALVDVRVLDHFVVAGNHCTSLAERGLI